MAGGLPKRSWLCRWRVDPACMRAGCSRVQNNVYVRAVKFPRLHEATWLRHERGEACFLAPVIAIFCCASCSSS